MNVRAIAFQVACAPASRQGREHSHSSSFSSSLPSSRFWRPASAGIVQGQRPGPIRQLPGAISNNSKSAGTCMRTTTRTSSARTISIFSSPAPATTRICRASPGAAAWRDSTRTRRTFRKGTSFPIQQVGRHISLSRGPFGHPDLNGNNLPQARNRSYNMSKSVNSAGNLIDAKLWLPGGRPPEVFSPNSATIQFRRRRDSSVFIDENEDTLIDSQFGYPLQTMITAYWWDMPSNRPRPGSQPLLCRRPCRNAGAGGPP